MNVASNVQKLKPLYVRDGNEKLCRLYGGTKFKER